MFPSIILLLDHLSKIFQKTFWASGQGCQKCVYMLKVTFRGKLKFKMAEFVDFWLLLISALKLEVTFQI